MICECCNKPAGILLRRDGKKICVPCEKAEETREIAEEDARKKREKKSRYDRWLADRAAKKAARIAKSEAARAALLALPIASPTNERGRRAVYRIAGCDGRFYWETAGAVSIRPEYVERGWVLARVARRWPGVKTNWMSVAFEPVEKRNADAEP